MVLFNEFEPVINYSNPWDNQNNWRATKEAEFKNTDSAKELKSPKERPADGG